MQKPRQRWIVKAESLPWEGRLAGSILLPDFLYELPVNGTYCELCSCRRAQGRPDSVGIDVDRTWRLFVVAELTAPNVPLPAGN